MAVTIAALVCFAQLLSALHFVVTTHEVCAEHGELVHSGDEGHLAHSGTSHIDSNIVRLFPNVSDTAHDHDPCLCIIRPTEVATRVQHVHWLAESAAIGLCPTVAPASFSVLHFAPKSSPPHV